MRVPVGVGVIVRMTVGTMVDVFVAPGGAGGGVPVDVSVTVGVRLGVSVYAGRGVNVARIRVGSGVKVVLGGDGRLSLERYARGRDLVLAGYSKRLILFYPSADELRDARARVPEVEVVKIYLQ